jgi:hypothetical protein
MFRLNGWFLHFHLLNDECDCCTKQDCYNKVKSVYGTSPVNIHENISYLGWKWYKMYHYITRYIISYLILLSTIPAYWDGVYKNPALRK